MRKLKNINLTQLVADQIITEETANAIWSYYTKKQVDAPNRLSMALTILGATLVGLGILLIIAHNWDNLSRFTKTILAFLPLLLGQIACGYGIIRKKGKEWKEGAATFLFFAIGACISMVSQIYHLEGDLGSFLLTWMVLCLPMVYAIPSSIVSLLYIGGITWYATNCGYGIDHEPYIFWGLLAAIIPHYLQLYHKQSNSNAFSYHSWAIALSILITLGLWAKDIPNIMWIAYVGLMTLYFMLGNQPFFKAKKITNNPFLVIGLLGTILLFLIFTFRPYWEELERETFSWSALFSSQEFWVSLLLIIVNIVLLFQQKYLSKWTQLGLVPIAFILYILAFSIGSRTPITSIILSNIFVAVIGLFYIWKGNQINNLGLLNLGLLTIAALIICRFFDLDMSFITRGILFIMVGISFFVANYQLIKRRKSIQNLNQ